MKTKRHILACLILFTISVYNCFAQEYHGGVSIPIYKGGVNALKEFINKNISHPKDSTQEIISGVVTVSYIINELGKPESIKISRGLNKYCDAEAIRVTQLMPDWQPAIQWGKAVKAKIFMPIEFVSKTNKSLNNFTVSGVITDNSNGKTIQGTLVLIKGTNNGAVTDENGYYTLVAPNEEAEIEFSSIGYTTKIEKVGKNNTINAELVARELLVDFENNRLK